MSNIYHKWEVFIKHTQSVKPKENQCYQILAWGFIFLCYKGRLASYRKRLKTYWHQTENFLNVIKGFERVQFSLYAVQCYLRPCLFAFWVQFLCSQWIFLPHCGGHCTTSLLAWSPCGVRVTCRWYMGKHFNDVSSNCHYMSKPMLSYLHKHLVV